MITVVDERIVIDRRYFQDTVMLNIRAHNGGTADPVFKLLELRHVKGLYCTNA
jgi:hypothetical protein